MNAMVVYMKLPVHSSEPVRMMIARPCDTVRMYRMILTQVTCHKEKPMLRGP
jgi:hypothetical protein